METRKSLRRIAAAIAAVIVAVPAFSQNNSFLSELMNGIAAASSENAYSYQDPEAAMPAMTTMGALNSLQGTRASGLVIGMNFGGKAVGDDKGGSVLDRFNVGYVTRIGLPFGFALQPALMYNTKKINLKSVVMNDVLSSSIGFIEIPLQLQWGISIKNFRPFVFGEPFVGYGISEKTNLKQYLTDTVIGAVTSEDGFNVTEVKDNVINKLEYGYGLGGGVSYGPLQLSLKYFRNLGNLYIDETNIGSIGDIFSSAMKENNYIDGFTFSIGLVF